MTLALRAIVLLLSGPGLASCGGPDRLWQRLPEISDCDAARTVCETAGPGIRVRLRLGPEIQAMRPFPVVVEVPAADSVVIRFEMPGMEMGKNVYRLDRVASDRWEGKAILPICLSGRTDWVARVEIKRKEGRYLAVFPFHVGA